jgi:hypothetical protein
VNSVEKTLSMLEAIAAPDGSSSLAALTARVDVPKSTAHRILQILAEASPWPATSSASCSSPGPARAAVLDLREAGQAVRIAAGQISARLRAGTEAKR